jgi:hypothetical protein
MIEILPPLGKYKYDTWRILPVKCYIDNSVRLRSYIRNVNKHFWRCCRGGSQYLLYVYRLHGIILTSIISLTDLSAALWLFVVVTGKCFVGSKLLTVHHSFLRFTSRFISIGLLRFLIQQVSKKSNWIDLRMGFKQLADETLIEAWERVIEPPRGGVHQPRSAWAILGEARTQSTHISTITYIEVQIEVITT